METLDGVEHLLLQYLWIASFAGAALPVGAWLFVRGLRVRAAVHRHMVWLWCLVGIAAAPPLWLYAPKLTLAILPARPTASPVAPLLLDPGPAIPMPAGDLSHAVPVDAAPPAWRTLLVGAWLCGAGLMLARLAAGWRQLRRMVAGAVPTDETEGLVTDRRIRVMLSDAVAGPICFGIWRPIILLPRATYLQSAARDRCMVLRHEMAHVQRRDAWVNLLQRAIEAVLFFHPGVWIASRRLTQERELICDNHVLADGTQPDLYAEILARVAEAGMAGPIQAAALFEGRLLQRVKALLDPRGVRLTRASRLARVACAAAAVTLGALGLVRFAERPVEAAALAHDSQPATSQPSPAEADRQAELQARFGQELRQLQAEVEYTQRQLQAKIDEIQQYMSTEAAIPGILNQTNVVTDNLMRLGAMRTEARARLEALKAQYEAYQKGGAEKMPLTPEIITAVEQDPLLLEIEKRRLRLQEDLAAIKSGPHTPEQVNEIKARLEVVDQAAQARRLEKIDQYKKTRLEQIRLDLLGAVDQANQIDQQYREAEAAQTDMDRKRVHLDNLMEEKKQAEERLVTGRQKLNDLAYIIRNTRGPGASAGSPIPPAGPENRGGRSTGRINDPANDGGSLGQSPDSRDDNSSRKTYH